MKDEEGSYETIQKKKKKNKPTATPSGEIAQKLTSATSKQGLNKEEQAALLRVRTGPECPENNLRELM